MKRNLEIGEGNQAAKKRLKAGKGDGDVEESGWPYLPAELAHMFLAHVANQCSLQLSTFWNPSPRGVDYYDIIAYVVTRSVCRQWTALLPPCSILTEKQCRFAVGESLIEHLVQEDNPTLLRWFVQNGGSLPKSIRLCQLAVEKGSIEMLTLAKEQRCAWSPDCYSIAAKKGHIHVLNWLRDQGCVWNEGLCASAASVGRIEVLEWARANGRLAELLDPLTCAKAAEGGHLETLKWLREAGCAWDENTTFLAATNGRVELLEWAIERGCPWFPHTFAWATQEVKQWGLTRGSFTTAEIFACQHTDSWVC